MGRTGNGVEVREASIRLSFTWEGQACRETLKTDGKPMPPTPANVRWATRLAAEIRDKIRHGSFVYGDYFPDSRRATTGHATTLEEHLGLWLRLQSGLANSTLKGYQATVSWWCRQLGAKPLKAIKHSDILAALASEPAWTGKTRNNKVSTLRRALQLAIRDGALKTNPLDGVEAAQHQSPPPDPFSREEAEAIIAGLRERYHPQIANHFEFKFFTGLRTSEALALRWESVDWRSAHIAVSEAIVLGRHKTTTKTHTARIVQLNSRALAALAAQKEHTLLQADGWAFRDPGTGERWASDWKPRELYWRPTLKRLGIRYRSPYETRHTYATMMLMAGVTPAYAARQLGHSVEMFLRTYSKWLDGEQNVLEMGRLEEALGGSAAPIPPRRIPGLR